MAKSNKAKGKEPCPSDHANNLDSDLRDRLTRQAQVHAKKKRTHKAQVTVDNNDSENEEDAATPANGGRHVYVEDSDDNGDYPLEAEDDDWAAHAADREESIRELQDQLKQFRAEHADLLLRKQAAAQSTTGANVSRSKFASARAPATIPARAPAVTSVRAPTATPARASATAPARASAATPARAPTTTQPRASAAVPVQAPAAAPAYALPGHPSELPPLVYPDAPNWIPRPKNKVDHTMAKIRAGLGIRRPSDWLVVQDTVRQIIIRSGLDTNRLWKLQDPTKLVLLYPILEKRIPGLKSFQDNWATARIIQAKFNNRRGYQLDVERQEREVVLAEALVAQQMDLDNPDLEHFEAEPESEPEPEPVPVPQRHVQTVSARRALSLGHSVVSTGTPAAAVSAMQPSPHGSAPTAALAPTPAADAPPADPTPLEKPRGKVRPKMRPPPPANDKSLAPTNDPTAKKRSSTEAVLELEPTPKKPRPKGPKPKQPPAAPATINLSDSLVNAAGTSAAGPNTRQSTLRSSKAVTAAATALKRTDAAHEKLPLKETPQNKGKSKGKRPASPSSSLSGPLEPQSVDPSVNDDGFHSPGEDE